MPPGRTGIPFLNPSKLPPCSQPPHCSGARAEYGAGRLHLFAQGSDGTVWYNWTSDGLAWNGWESLREDRVDSEVAVVAWNDSQIDIYGRGENGVIQHDHFDGSDWTGWVRFVDQLPLAPCDPTASCPGPTVTSSDPGRLDLFIQGADGTLYMDEWLDHSWHDWVQQGTNVIVSDPAASSDSIPVAWTSSRD